MCNLSLICRQPSRFESAVGQEEHQYERPGEGYEAKNDKDPSPSRNLVMYVTNGITCNPTKDAGHAVASEPNSMSPSMLRRLIPETSDQTKAGTDDTFKTAEEDSKYHEACKA